VERGLKRSKVTVGRKTIPFAKHNGKINFEKSSTRGLLVLDSSL